MTIHSRPSRRRRFAALAVTLAGVAALVGSGGGSVGFPPLGDLQFGTPPPMLASVSPSRVTAQVGTAVTFTVTTSNLVEPVTYAWCRTGAGVSGCVPIAGASTATLRLPAVNLGDDGSSYQVAANGATGSAFAVAALAVAAAPPVVFADADFAPADWEVSALSDPAGNGPTATVVQSNSGGNPGAFRSTAISVPVVPSSIQVFHLAAQAVYQPAVQGAIYVIDASADCQTGGDNAGTVIPFSAVLIEQSGRRYLAETNRRSGCNSSPWIPQLVQASLKASDFRRVSGAACGAGESCPDFGPQAAPLRLGYAVLASFPVGTRTGTMLYNTDNWRLSVWRR